MLPNPPTSSRELCRATRSTAGMRQTPPYPSPMRDSAAPDPPGLPGSLPCRRTVCSRVLANFRPAPPSSETSRHHHAYGCRQRRSDGPDSNGRIGNELALGRVSAVGRVAWGRNAQELFRDGRSHGRRDAHPREKQRAYGLGRRRNPRGALLDQERGRSFRLNARHRRTARLLPPAAGNRRIRVSGSSARSIGRSG